MAGSTLLVLVHLPLVPVWETTGMLDEHVEHVFATQIRKTMSQADHVVAVNDPGGGTLMLRAVFGQLSWAVPMALVDTHVDVGVEDVVEGRLPDLVWELAAQHGQIQVGGFHAQQCVPAVAAALGGEVDRQVTLPGAQLDGPAEVVEVSEQLLWWAHQLDGRGLGDVTN